MLALFFPPSPSCSPVVSVKSRGCGAITCRDASALPGTHHLPSGCIQVRKPCQHPKLEGLVVWRGGRQRRERRRMTEGKEEVGERRQEAREVQVTVGSDSGGQCQASFRIPSLRSSCYIFYWANKGTTCYSHVRVNSLGVASKRSVWGKTKFFG